MAPVSDVDDGELLDAVLAASRSLVAISAQSIAAVADRVDVVQLRVLVVVASRGSCTLGEIADAANLHMSTASRTCDRIVAAGLLHRTSREGDRRTLELTLTPEGEEVVGSVLRQRRTALQPVLGQLTGSQRRRLATALRDFARAAGEPSDRALWGDGLDDRTRGDLHMTSTQTVVVTGASGGIGRATAIAFGKQGAAVALLARGERGLRGAARDVESAGGRALPIEVDVAHAAAVDDAAERIESELGSIDVWVNVAFSSVFAPFWEINADEFRRATEVTYLGYVYGTMAALRRMRVRNRGTIVQVGSALAYRGIPLQSAYCGAKHAVQGFNESLRCELLHEKSGVHVTMVQMPAVNTPQFSWVLTRLPRHPQPVAPIYQPEVAAQAVLRAVAHPRRREYWVGTSTALTLAANAVAPGLLDRYLARTGFTSQQTDQPEDPNAPANLWEPADDADGHDFGAHGEFDDKAVSHDPQLWASRHHGLLGLLGAGAAGISAALIRRRR